MPDDVRSRGDRRPAGAAGHRPAALRRQGHPCAAGRQGQLDPDARRAGGGCSHAPRPDADTGRALQLCQDNAGVWRLPPV